MTALDMSVIDLRKLNDAALTAMKEALVGVPVESTDSDIIDAYDLVVAEQRRRIPITSTKQVAKMLDPGEAALAAARVLTVLGSDESWNADTLDAVAQSVRPLMLNLDLPDFGDQDTMSTSFWGSLTW